jgi:hypothetical protein
VWLRTYPSGKFLFPDILRLSWSKKWPCARPTKSAILFLLLRANLPAFTSGFSLLLFAHCLERTSSISSQSLPRGIRSSCQVADEFEDDLPYNRVRRRSKTAERKPGVSTQDNDNLAKTLRAVQMVTTWHDANVHGDKRQHFPRHRIRARRWRAQ